MAKRALIHLFLRLWRMVKILKVLLFFRLLRIMRQGSRELRLIMNSLLGCAKVAVWSLITIFMASFFFGLCIIQGCTDYLKSYKDYSVPEKVQEEIELYWGSLGKALETLYKSVTGGNDWTEYAHPLENIDGGIYFAIFWMYIAVYNFILVNALSSLFVEATLANSRKDLELAVDNAMEEDENTINRLTDWFRELDADNDGFISYAEFDEFVCNPRMLAFAHTLGIEIMDVEQFIRTISKTPYVDLETFVNGCIRVKGPAKNLDLFEVIAVLEQTKETCVKIGFRLTKFEYWCKSQLELMQAELACCHG